MKIFEDAIETAAALIRLHLNISQQGVDSIASGVVSLKAVDVPVTRWAPWFGLSSNPNWASTSTAEQVRLSGAKRI